MVSLCFYFLVHLPCWLRNYTIFESESDYFEDRKNAEIYRKVAEKCYLPSNLLLLDLIKRFKGKFKISYSITGVLLEQLRSYAPRVLASFQELAASGCVEFLGETYYHSLSSVFSQGEFVEQVEAHRQAVKKFFGQIPRIFRNTELIYNNDLAAVIERIGGFDAILTEGADRILGYRSPNFVYRPPHCKKLKLLLRNWRLSSDIGFKLSGRSWNERSIQDDKYVSWINAINNCGHVVNLFLDYESFGEHWSKSPSMFEFMRHLLEELLEHSDNDFKMPSEVVASYDPVDAIDVPHTISWADRERDLSTWIGNPMQENALAELYRLEDRIKATQNRNLIADWRKLQASDHFHYMSTKHFSDGTVRKNFNPYDSPYDAYINFMNILDDLTSRCAR